MRITLRPSLRNAPLLVADEEGYFRRQGLELDATTLGARESVPSLLEGTMDVGAGFVNASYFNAIARGGTLRVVADGGHLATDGCTSTALVARKQLMPDGRLRKRGPTERWRIGLRRGTINEFLLEEALRQEGIPLGSVDLDYLDAATEREALRKGMIDAAMMNGADLEQALETGAASVWRTGQDLAPGLQVMVLTYGPSFLEKDPAAGRRFMAAYLQGVRQLGQGKTERNLEILQKRLGLDRETLRRSCWIAVRGDGEVDVAGLVAFQAWAHGKGLLERTLEPGEFWEPGFVRAKGPEPSASARAPRGP